MIKLKNNYFIESDGTQLILKQKKTAKRKDTEEEYEKEDVLGYYLTLQMAFEGYMRNVILENVKEKDMQIENVIEMIKELKEEFKSIDKL